jgi:hypothetical protein
MQAKSHLHQSKLTSFCTTLLYFTCNVDTVCKLKVTYINQSLPHSVQPCAVLYVIEISNSLEFLPHSVQSCAVLYVIEISNSLEFLPHSVQPCAVLYVM